MTSTLRPLIACLLIGVAVFGHAPAWVHIAGCEHGNVASTVEETVLCHSCCHHGDAFASQPKSSDHSKDAPLHQHDSDRCATCQSLATPLGVTWDFESRISCEIFVEQVKVITHHFLESTSLSIPQPRGPPISIG